MTTTTKFVDFVEIKSRVSIVQGAEFLRLALKPSGEQMRGACPRCKSGGDRALVVTPAKNAFYCFGGKAGGDVISLVGHVRDIGMKDAAVALAEEYGTGTDSTVRSNARKSTLPHSPANENIKGIKPLDYLEAEHPSVQALSLDAGFAQENGIGFAPKGIMRGRCAVPIFSPTGLLIAYVGLTPDPDVSPQLLFHSGFDPRLVAFGAHRMKDSEFRLASSPLEVLHIQQATGDVAVCFLTDVWESEQIEVLAALMGQTNSQLIP